MRHVIRSGITLLFTAGVLLAPATLALAADKARTDEEAAAASVENDLALSQEQKDKLKSLREDLRSKQTAISNDLRVAKNSLQKELDSANPDRKKADNLVATVNKLQSQMLVMRVDQVFSMRAILTPEQYQKLIQIREKRREDMKVKVQKQGRAVKSPAKAKPPVKK